MLLSKPDTIPSQSNYYYGTFKKSKWCKRRKTDLKFFQAVKCSSSFEKKRYYVVHIIVFFYTTERKVELPIDEREDEIGDSGRLARLIILWLLHPFFLF